MVTRLLPFVVLGCIAWKSVHGQSAVDLTPKPELTPQQVVEYQLTVLQKNDQPTPNAGIEKAFRFASPANQKSVGPISHFISIDYQHTREQPEQFETGIREAQNSQ